MIIVEGPDGAGKTTLCERICREFNLKMGERSEKDRDKIYQTTRHDSWRALHEELVCAEPPRVWDRIGPYSDPIYSSLGIPLTDGVPTPRECAFTKKEIHVFRDAVRSLGLVILCLPPLETVLENVQREYQLPGVPQLTKHVYTGYRITMGRNPIYLKYDYTQSTGDTNNPKTARGVTWTSLAMAISFHLSQRKERECLSS